MQRESLWTKFSDQVSFPRLIDDITVDVAIIGGGICGVTTAACLQDSGLKVCVLEALQIARSSTGHSTGNLYETFSDGLSELIKVKGADTAKEIVRSRREAISLIEQNVSTFSLDCDFRRVNRYFYTSVKAGEKEVEQEAKSLTLIDAEFSYDPIPEKRLQPRAGVVMSGQAQFNPQRYVEQLASKIEGASCEIYENSPVEKISSEAGMFILETAQGIVRAKKIVHASHTPKGISTFHTLLGPYREYGLAFKLDKKPHAEGMFFGFFDETSLISTRAYERDDHHYLVVVGGPHKVGQGDNLKEIERLNSFARAHFEVEELVATWGAQQYRPADHVPFIGPKMVGSDEYIATGFSSHGLVYGTVAAQLISDQLQGRENSLSKIYSPFRINPLKSAPEFIKENSNVFYEYVKDYVLETYPEEFHQLSVGEGKVIVHDGKKMAISKDDDGVHVCSAVCPHLGGIVHWNQAESSWDCPLHGSRFSCDGEVLEGPVFEDLKKYGVNDLEAKKENSLWDQAKSMLTSNQSEEQA